RPVGPEGAALVEGVVADVARRAIGVVVAVGAPDHLPAGARARRAASPRAALIVVERNAVVAASDEAARNGYEKGDRRATEEHAVPRGHGGETRRTASREAGVSSYSNRGSFQGIEEG